MDPIGVLSQNDKNYIKTVTTVTIKYKLVTNKHRLNGFVFVSLQCALKP